MIQYFRRKRQVNGILSKLNQEKESVTTVQSCIEN